jgi:hypothetical protein
VTRETRDVMGVRCVVVRDTATLDGRLIEDTFDWFAQDRTGTVWYFGEATTAYRRDGRTSTAGSWEAGVGGAQPGIVMNAQPRVGDTYRQEYRRGRAEDMGRVVSLRSKARVPAGNFRDLVKTRDFTPLEPGVVEHKYYARGVGLVLEVERGGRRVELVESRRP